MIDVEKGKYDKFIGETLRDWATQEPWVFTPPLIIGVTNKNTDDVINWIEEELYHHKLSNPEQIGGQNITGVIVAGENLKQMATYEYIDHVEIEGYGKEM